jgi:hypothetical protein
LYDEKYLPDIRKDALMSSVKSKVKLITVHAVAALGGRGSFTLNHS